MRKNQKRNHKSVVIFEGNNAIHWFPPEVEDANENYKRFYRRRAAKRWARAMIKAEEYNAEQKETRSKARASKAEKKAEEADA